MHEMLLLIVALVLCLLCWYFWSHRRILAEAMKQPAYFPNVLRMFKENDDTNIAFRLAKILSCNSTSAMTLWLGPFPVFMIQSPEDIQIAANNILARTKFIDVLGYFVGNGLMMAPVNVWRVTRPYIQPQFHPLNLELLMPSLNKCGQDLSQSLSKHVGMGLVDLTDDLFKVSLKGTCKLIFGPDEEVKLNSKMSFDFYQSAERVRHLLVTRSLKLWLKFEYLFKWLYGKDIKKIEKSIENIFPARFKRENGSNGKEEVKFEGSKGIGKHLIMSEIRGHQKYITLPDIFENLMQDNPSFSAKDLRFEITSMLFAGSETTYVTTLFCLLALASHPNIQEKLHAEVMSVVGKEDRDVTLEELKAMSYLDQVVKETLRKFLTIPLSFRVVDKDLKLSFGTLPAGSTVLLVISAVHLNSQYYPDPEKFNPDHFTPENVAKRQKHTFLPFLSGPRNCIGKTYGMMAIKTLLVHLIRKYHFCTNVDIDKINYLPGVVFRPKDIYSLEVQHRQ